jgi:hypothetical protein
MLKYPPIKILNLSVFNKNRKFLNMVRKNTLELFKFTRKNRTNLMNSKISYGYKNLKNFKNASLSTKNFSEKIDKEMFNYINEDFEKTLSSNEEDQEKRVRLLSLKLLQINHSKEIISLFEEKYIKGLVNTIYGEEISILLYFYVSILNRESGDENSSLKTPIIFGKI